MALTSEQLLDLDRVSQRVETVRFDVLDGGLNKIGEAEVDKERPPKITNDSTRKLKRSMANLRILPNGEADINTVADRIRPMWLLQNGAEFPLGVFLFGDASRTRQTFGVTLQATLVDQLFILDQVSESSIFFATGTNIGAALNTLASLAGFSTAGIELTALTLSNPFVKPAGKTTTLKAMTELALLAGFTSPFFDNEGVLRIVTVANLDLVPPDFVYNEGVGTISGRIIDESLVESDDLLKAPNRYIVIDNSSRVAPLVGTFDIPSSAPNSIGNRGFVVAKVIDAQGLTDQASADAAAEAAYAQDSDTFSWVSFTSTADPRHDTFNVVEYLGVRYREQAWSLTLDTGGNMTHQLRRIYTDFVPS